MIKKRVALLAAVLMAVSMWTQGCSKSAAETMAETTAEETTVEETTAKEEAAEALEGGVSEAAETSAETGIPAEYEKYLSWTLKEYTEASDEEKTEALVAYILYDGIIYQKVEGLTAEDVKAEPELESLRSVIETSLSTAEGKTLQEICDLGHSTVSINDVELDDAIVEKLQCTAEEWNAASDDEKLEVAKAMVIAIGKMSNQELTEEILEGEEMKQLFIQQVDSIQALFDSELYGSETLYNILGSAQ